MKVWALTRPAGGLWRQGREMRTTGKLIDPALLRLLYVDEGLSTVEIATKLGCADYTILRRLRRAGIDIRPRGPAPRSRAESIGIDWSPPVAYAVGLMATDGNLSGRKVSCR